MNYKKIYDALIQKRRNIPVPETEYSERHHIIPRSEGGSDNKDNLIRLTAREHYIAHLLLAKIYNDYKMKSAVIYMRSNSRNLKRQFKINNRLFEKMRIEHAKEVSIRHKGRPAWNKGRPHTEEAKKNMSIAHKGHKLSAETKKRMSAAHTGKKHDAKWNDSISRGRTGYRWITNGEEEKTWREDTPPTGWRFGRSKRSEVQ